MQSSHPSTSPQHELIQQLSVLEEILRNGCISVTFGREHAEHLFRSLLKTELRPLTSYMYSSAIGGAEFYSIQQEVLPKFRPNARSAEGHPLFLIDYKADRRRGSIVRQPLWMPHSQTDQRRYIESARLSLPIFFVHNDGAVGVSVADAAAGRCDNLTGAGMPVDMGDKVSTHLRIKWPGYVGWKRQFQTKDATKARNPITVERLVGHIGRSIDRFLETCQEDSFNRKPEWRIGHDGITRDRITVLGVCHVSSGSWMPILQVYPAVLDMEAPLADVLVDLLATN